ncbi:DUF2158 domain-containing protein [Acinetobacter sp. BSP-28]|uniref:DUF2158 domain-containing protein n=1 Tax=Acinetobacter sp. BSP-28 TaxID=3344661 RepID=UPI00376FCBC4
MSEISTGDVVYLRSGSPAMTVASKPNALGIVKCVWFVGTKADFIEVNTSALTKDKPKLENKSDVE